MMLNKRLLMAWLLASIGAAKVCAADDRGNELRYEVREATYPVRDTYLQPVVQPHQYVVVDDRSRSQLVPPSNTVIEGHGHIGNTICVNRDEYEEFMGWKYGRNQGPGDNGYRRNGSYGRGGNYRRGR